MPAQFAPVVPIHILQRLDEHGQAGRYHLLLAHDVVKHKRAYHKFFVKNCTRYNTVIMDNSVVELGGAVDLDMVEEAVEATRAGVVVLPDVYLYGPATVEATLTAIQPWFNRLTKLAMPIPQFMCVPQGQTYNEWVKCAEALANDKYIKWWGVPRNFTDRLGSRVEALQILHMLNSDRKIHLLGFSDNIVDDMLAARYGIAEGIDSAVPIRAASYNKEMSLTLEVPPRGDWWETAEFSMGMVYNAAKTRKMLDPTLYQYYAV